MRFILFFAYIVDSVEFTSLMIHVVAIDSDQLILIKAEREVGLSTRLHVFKLSPIACFSKLNKKFLVLRIFNFPAACDQRVLRTTNREKFKHKINRN